MNQIIVPEPETMAWRKLQLTDPRMMYMAGLRTEIDTFDHRAKSVLHGIALWHKQGTWADLGWESFGAWLRGPRPAGLELTEDFIWVLADFPLGTRGTSVSPYHRHGQMVLQALIHGDEV